MSEGKKEILLGDCLELMKDIPNGSIDMILCDLPYGTTACKWDVIIPFDKLWEQYERIIKPNGAIVLTASQPFTSALIMSNPKCFKYEWIWNKQRTSNPMLAKIQPMKTHENILVFSNGKTNYYPQFTDKKNDETIKRDKRKNGYNNSKSEHFELKYTIRNSNEYKYPESVLNIKRDNGNNQFLNTTVKHPTQKPVALFEYLIKTYTNEGDLVLDNCAGSGTTAIACLNTNRQFIVMEKEQKYYDIILKRVEDFNKKFEPQTLFGNEM
jgi:site-specific DNA-methyltransferase (adenine-specific)